MTASPVKTSQLPQVNTLSSTDMVVAVSNTGGIQNTVIIPLGRMLGNSGAIPIIATPATSTSISCPAGSIMTDGTYLYVATSSNVLKRVALSSF